MKAGSASGEASALAADGVGQAVRASGRSSRPGDTQFQADTSGRRLRRLASCAVRWSGRVS